MHAFRRERFGGEDDLSTERGSPQTSKQDKNFHSVPFTKFLMPVRHVSNLASASHVAVIPPARGSFLGRSQPLRRVARHRICGMLDRTVRERSCDGPSLLLGS